MVSGPTQAETRQRRAREAMDALGAGGVTAERLTVQCARSHHLAAVFETASGPVVRTHPGPHAHGRKDFVDTGHHGGHRPERLELLAAGPGADDTIPAWCDCGPVELSREALRVRLGQPGRTVRLTEL
jgi:hypothetical protein